MLKHFIEFGVKLGRARDGAAMLEFTIIALLLLLVTCGMVDFTLAFQQWNNASKAAGLGARLAAVSDPVAGPNGANNRYFSTLSATAAINITCSGSTSACTGGGTYDSTAMNTIVFGRGKTACSAVVTGQLPAMCNIFPGLTASKVTVNYNQPAYATSGLGLAGNAAGPTPTVTVAITGVTFSFYFLNSLLQLSPMSMPTMSTTVTGEDLSTSGS